MYCNVYSGRRGLRPQLSRLAQGALRTTAGSSRAVPVAHPIVAALRPAPRCSAAFTRHYIAPASGIATESTAPRQPRSARNWGNPSRSQEDTPLDNIATLGKPSREAYDNPQFASDDLGNALNLVDLIRRDRDRPNLEKPPAEKHHLRLVPRTGRTVHVSKGVDVARSFKLLAIQVAQNRVRNDFYKQRFHERPGLKRKRLKSERWQARFRRGFKATVARVRELNRQGW
ncbi:hypothetical protein GGR57DRAFT_489382 [Xylariaceae sp. FL1272]|nr:hypothetical protein GGR57DRAFT_489382 [Xylariaceae sp. FL1272]